MTVQRYSLALLFTLTSLCIPLRAEGDGDSTKTYILDPVTVTATQIEALRSSLPNAVSIVTRKDIESSGETSLLPLIGKRVPGVFVTERGVLGYGVATGAAGGISMRGLGGSPNTQVLVLTDGRPQLMGLFGHPLSDTYVTSDVSRVEILRGPASIVHGTNAMGGVINIISERMSGPGSRLSLGASYGSFGTQKIDAGGGWSSGPASISASGSYYYTDGHRPYSEFRIRNGSVRGSVQLDEHFTFNPDFRISAFRTFDPGPASTQTIDHWVDIVRGSSGFSLENTYDNMRGALKMFYNFGVHDIYDGFHSSDNNIGALLYQGFQPFSGNMTTAGVDFKRYGGKANNTISGFNLGNHLVSEYGGYVLIQQSVSGLATVTAGLRMNHHSLYGNEFAPQAGIAVPLSESGTIRFSAGKGFRSPTIRELYLFPAPTPTLEPERVWSYEAGVRQEIGTTVSFEATGYINRGSNIIRVGGAFPNLLLSNSGSFTHRGVELAASIRPSSWIDLDLAYGYLDVGDQTNANPKHKVFAGGSMMMERLTFSVGMQYVARLFGDDFSRKALGDYVLLNARATAQLPGGLSAYVAGENLLNRQYQIIFDYPMPGATFFAGLRWTMERADADVNNQP